MKESTNNRYSIQSIEKALDVIEALCVHRSLSLIELSEIAEQPKSSLFRIITTLEGRGYIDRDEENGKYCLGYRQLMVSKNLLENNTLRNAAFQQMKNLNQEYGDTVNLGVLVEGLVLYTEIIEGTFSLRMNETVGSTSAFYATAIGKAIAAYLTRSEQENLIDTTVFEQKTKNTIITTERLFEELALIREQGYALDDEESEIGARCIAAPIFQYNGKVEGAVSLSGAIHRFPDEEVTQIGQKVTLAANRISKKLGYSI